MQVAPTRIKQARAAAAMSQEEFADAIGVTRVTVSMWETGGSVPRPYWLRRLAKFSGVDVTWFYEDEAA